MKTEINIISINGQEYVKASDVPEAQPNGNRAVVVVDRGWIFAGDVTEHEGRITLTRAVWVFQWESIGFNGVLENPDAEEVELRPMANEVDIPAGSEIFRIPVEDGWGL